MASESDSTDSPSPINRRQPSTTGGLHMLHLLPAEDWHALAAACGIARRDLDDAIVRGVVHPEVQALLQWVAGWLWPFLAATTAMGQGSGLRLHPDERGTGWIVRPTSGLLDAIVSDLVLMGPSPLPIASRAPEGD